MAHRVARIGEGGVGKPCVTRHDRRVGDEVSAAPEPNLHLEEPAGRWRGGDFRQRAQEASREAEDGKLYAKTRRTGPSVWRWSTAAVPVCRYGGNVCCSDWRAPGIYRRVVAPDPEEPALTAVDRQAKSGDGGAYYSKACSTSGARLYSVLSSMTQRG